MADDASASPGEDEGDGLTPAHLDIYWYFADSRGRKGTPTVTRSHCQNDFSLKWAQLVSLMQEIEDAGYWVIGDNGTPKFNPDKTPARRWRPWHEDSDVPGLLPTPTSPAAPAPGHGHAGTQATSLKKPESRRSHYVGTSSRRHGAEWTGIFVNRTSKTQARLVKRYGRDSYQLVEYFQYKLAKAYGGFSPDVINCAALGANIKQWMATDDMTYQAIQKMMDLFVAEWKFQRKGTPAWKAFLAQREKLYTQVVMRIDDEQRSERTGEVRITGHMPRKEH